MGTPGVNPPTPSQEVAATSAEALTKWPPANWAEAQLVGPDPLAATENGWTGTVTNGEQLEQRGYAPAYVAATEVALADVVMAPEGRRVHVDVEVSQVTATEWFWTLLGQAGYERW